MCLAYRKQRFGGEPIRQPMSIAPRPLAFFQRFQGAISLVLLLAAAALIPASRQSFFQPGAYESIASQVAVPGALAIGMTFVILTGGIDLSVGSMVALLTVVAAKWALVGHSFAFVSVGVLALGAMFGAINGLLVALTGLQAFIVTLASMATLRGAAFLYTRSNVSGFQPIFSPFQGKVGPIPVHALLLVAMATLGWLFLAKTRYGRYIYAVGGNESAARLSGVPVSGVKVLAYGVNGFCAAIASLLLLARTNVGEPGGAIEFELNAIAAAVVGGASLFGGYGSIWGSFTGAVFMQTLTVLMILWSIDDKLALGLKGPIILLAVYLQSLGRKS